MPLRIAQTQGIFQQERIEAELIQMRAGITMAAMATGDLDFAAPLDSIIRNAGFKVLGHAGSFMELSTPGLGTTERLLKQSPTKLNGLCARRSARSSS